jgi:hypothetical protein
MTHIRLLGGGAARRAGLLALLCAALVSVAACGLGASTATGAQSTPTTPASATDAATATEAPPWFTYHDLTYGFTLDVPSALGIAANNASQQADPYAVSFALNPARVPPVPADQQTLSQLGIVILVSHKVIDSCGVGTPTTIGGSITAYETNNFSDIYTPGPGTPPPPFPRVTAQFVASGLYYEISITGLLPMNTFMQRYGDAVHHILASFQPGPQQAAGSPCA